MDSVVSILGPVAKMSLVVAEGVSELEFNAIKSNIELKERIQFEKLFEENKQRRRMLFDQFAALRDQHLNSKEESQEIDLDQGR
jgi:hypothetical protein